MRGLAEYQWGPGITPRIIRNLIIWTSCITLLSAFVQSIIMSFTTAYGPQDYLSLSWWGLQNWYLWQPLTFLFIQPLFYQGITFFFLITLLFNMYILWVMGSAIVDYVGVKPFLKLYFISGIGAGLIALAAMPVTGHYSALAGPAASILALLMAWTMMHPEIEILLFFLIPLKVKWIMAGIIAGVLLTTISQGDVGSLIFYLAGIFIGYGYGVIAWGLQGPFAFTHKIDHFLNRLRYQRQESSGKIINIKTGQPEASDDHFVDEMLEKIAKHGEKSLSWRERQRLQRISEQKKKKLHR